MSEPVNAIPEGFHALTAHLTVRGGKDAIAFYQKAFGAELIGEPHLLPDGKVMHAALRIGDSMFMLNDEFPKHGGHSPLHYQGSAVCLNLYVEDADAVFQQAVAAGATVTMPVADQFWGDRYGKLTDPFGHEWAVATRKENLTAEEIAARAQAAFGG